MTEETTTTANTEAAAPMRLRADPPRVTRLSRKMLAGVGAVALLGIGGALKTGDAVAGHITDAFACTEQLIHLPGSTSLSDLLSTSA